MIIDTKSIKGSRERYSINKNGKEHGLYRFWYSNGNLSHEINYKNGKEHGLYRFWYLSGNLSFETKYKNGIEVE